MTQQPDAMTVFIAYASVLLLAMILLSMFIGWVRGLRSVNSARPVAIESPEHERRKQSQTDAAKLIATPQTTHNVPIVFDPFVEQLATLTGDDPADLHAQITVLARLCDTPRKTKAGVFPILGETDAIRYGLGITPGSTNPKYAAAKAALAALRQAPEQPGPTFPLLTPEQEARRKELQLS